MDRIYRIEWEGRPQHVIERAGRWHLLEGDLFEGYGAGPAIDPGGARWLAPVLPSKIVAIGLNYRDHAAETGKPVPAEPLVFLKPSTAVIGPGDPIRVPAWAGRVDPEAEVAIVIARRACRVSEEEAQHYILGLTCFNDVTARDLQRRDGQFARSKGFDTFAPLGPCVAVGLEGGALDVDGLVNGERRQSSNTRELIFSIPRLVAHVTAFMTLLPGDLLATGTPAGIAPVHPGDTVTVRVAEIGELTNPVEAAGF